MIDGNYHLVKYSWIHAFSLVIWCERCAHNFKVGEVIFKQVRKVDRLIFNYYFCLSCAKKLKLKGAPE